MNLISRLTCVVATSYPLARSLSLPTSRSNREKLRLSPSTGIPGEASGMGDCPRAGREGVASSGFPRHRSLCVTTSSRRERGQSQILPILAILFSLFTLSSVTNAQTTQPTSAPAPASLELISHLQKQLSTVESVQADFIQVKNLAVLKHKLTIRGSFALQKPNRVMWIVREPVRYAIRVDGEEVRQWDEDTNKVQIIHLGGDPTFKAVSEQIQAWFLGDYKQLAGSYEVFVISDKPLALRFAPKAGTMVAKLISQIEVTFGPDEMNIDKMRIHEATGDNTDLTFVNTRLNQPVPKETWEIPPR
jgi:outer membrane lipoprotein-sorting protein